MQTAASPATPPQVAAAAVLIPDIVERISFHLADDVRSSFHRYHATGDLRAASLVCHGWREPAQRLLLAIVYLEPYRKTVQAYYRAFVEPSRSPVGGYARFLSIGDFPMDADDIRTLLACVQTFRGLTELCIEPVIQMDDNTMGRLLAPLLSLKILSLRYTLRGDAWTLSESLIESLPRLPRLEHLYLERICCHPSEGQELPGLAMPNLRQLAVVDCTLGRGVLPWLCQSVGPSLITLVLCSSDVLMVYLLEACFSTVSPNLRHLCFFHMYGNWRNTVQGPSPGGFLLDRFPCIEKLAVEDSSLTTAALARLTSLKELKVATRDQRAFLQGLLEHSPPRLRKVQLGRQRIYDEQYAMLSTANTKGWEECRLGCLVNRQLVSMYTFTQHLPFGEPHTGYD